MGRSWHAEVAAGWGERREGSGPWFGFSESDHFCKEEVHGNTARRLVSRVLRNSGTAVGLPLLPLTFIWGKEAALCPRETGVQWGGKVIHRT